MIKISLVALGEIVGEAEVVASTLTGDPLCNTKDINIPIDRTPAAPMPVSVYLEARQYSANLGWCMLFYGHIGHYLLEKGDIVHFRPGALRVTLGA